MKKIIQLLLLLFCATGYPTSGRAQVSDSLFYYYQNLNNSEQGLNDYRDDSLSLLLKLKQLDIINRNRAKHKLRALELDILACRLANKSCKEAAENSYTSHWNMAGEKPYLRWSNAGGTDHIAENTYGLYSSKAFDQNRNSLESLVREAHAGFMEERRPYDGHKRNVLDKNHNYVGLGYYLSRNNFSYTELFIDRYVRILGPDSVRAGENFQIEIDCPDSLYLYFMVAYYEGFPKPRNPKQLNHLGSYDDYSDHTALKLEPWKLSAMRNHNLYTIPLAFQRKGLYYIHLYLNEKDIKNASSYNTQGKIQASGYVVHVI